MPTITDNAICIRRWDFSETSQTVSLLARGHGVLRGLLKEAKRATGPFGGGIDLLNAGQIVAIVKPGRDLATVTEWHLRETYPALRRDLEANRAGLYMADLVHHMLTEHDPHPRVFDAIREALETLAQPEAIGPALLRFEWTLLCETGYRPRLDADAETGEPLPAHTPTVAFSARAGGVVSDTGQRDRWRVRRETIALLETLAAGCPIDDADRPHVERATRLLASYIRELLGSEPHAMRWAFPDLAR